MSSISNQALMMALQAMNQAMEKLHLSIKSNGEEDPDDYEMLLAYTKCENELKNTYAEARQADPDLPSYERLVEAARNNF